MENRRCFGVSSCIGGEAGLSKESAADMAGWLADEDMPSLGGVTGGAGTTTRVGVGSGTAERDEYDEGGSSEADSDLERGCLVENASLADKESLLRLRRLLCLLMSDSLAMTPRRRRNGMSDDHMWQSGQKERWHRW